MLLSMKQSIINYKILSIIVTKYLINYHSAYKLKLLRNDEFNRLTIIFSTSPETQHMEFNLIKRYNVHTGFKLHTTCSLTAMNYQLHQKLNFIENNELNHLIIISHKIIRPRKPSAVSEYEKGVKYFHFFTFFLISNWPKGRGGEMKFRTSDLFHKVYPFPL
jgi:hypothetical protein